MSTPSAEDFRALARSSPERWSTLRFTVRWSGPWAPSDPVRAWLRRPDRLRVETLDGALVQVVREGSGPGRARLPVRELSADDPMFQNYAWVAMLDPVELADGDDERDGPAVVVGDLSVADHGGARPGRPSCRPARPTTRGARAARCSRRRTRPTSRASITRPVTSTAAPSSCASTSARASAC